MIENQQCTILIYQGSGKDRIIQNKTFNNVRDLNECFNKINGLSCTKEIWLDECYISFKFKTTKSFFKALKVLQCYRDF